VKKIYVLTKIGLELRGVKSCDFYCKRHDIAQTIVI